MTDHGDERLGPASADPSAERADSPALPAPRQPSQWRARWPFVLIVVWAAFAAANVVLFGDSSSAPSAQATRIAAGPRVATTANSPSAVGPSSRPSPAPIPVAQVLAPVTAAAYGPTGTGSGDNPGHAYQAIDASSATAWLTDWYRSASFGNLQAGTGLLIDMGRQVTITVIGIILGSRPGADLDVLIGNSVERSQMLVEGRVSDAEGSVSLIPAHPEPARYLLIWFTRLPPDSAGTFQASVYDVRLVGTP